MSGFPILSLMLLVPLVAGLVCLYLDAKSARALALAATLADLALGIVLWLNFDIGGAQWQFTERANLFSGFSYALGIDGIALLLIVLTVFLMPICIGASWKSIDKRVGEYMAAFLIMETLMLGSFMAQDLFLFYIFFEACLIPMYLVIGIWGGPKRIYASYKFFLYTLLGSVLMLIAMLWMVNETGTSDIPTLMAYDFSPNAQFWLFLGFLASFAVKMPMWPVHTWLPAAHVEAPTGGSIILAGVLLKMGGYGLLRFSLPMFPDASVYFAPLVWGLAMAAVIITSLIAAVQLDMKKLIAYSSVAHMAIDAVGLFSFNRQGLEGAMVLMLSHGVVSGALFLCVGVIYERLHTREIMRYRGLAVNMPRYAVFFMLFTMGSIGLPGLSGFVGEFLSLAGVFRVSTWTAAVCTTTVVLGAVYMLYLYRKVVFGAQVNADAAAMRDLNVREFVMMVPMAAVVVWMGVYPESFIAPIRDDIIAIDARLADVKPDEDAKIFAYIKEPLTPVAAANEETR